eukprot:CAMPEP_0118932902 /NCGR_PEP_ID=MMETSP1169-20130426/10681_1 /TAXON_ID=36882 /ORGANISM="Pyramimonas obovata, Strain CCMP722" /LENGTH=180 /DNA_ID=CAMNT_0006875607 /DNA_START=7 /DNA_END=549 /DNA_ORIENTATION=+
MASYCSSASLLARPQSLLVGKRLAASATPRCATRRARVVISASDVSLNPIGAGAPITIEGASAVLGSSKDADFLVKGALVAAKHARIDKKGTSVYVTDLETEEGTYIEDNRLRSGVQYLLGPGSTLRLGGSEESGSGTEFSVSFEKAETSAMDEMLLSAFQMKFKGSASDEVKKMMDDML